MRPVVPLVLALLLTACPKNVAPPAPQMEAGWNTISGHACYSPPDFNGAQSSSDRRALRGTAMTEAARRWRGEVDPAFTLPSEQLDALENTLMTSPDATERILLEDFQHCIEWANGRLDLNAYQAWLKTAASEVASAGCHHPGFASFAQYLDITQRWQIEIPICKDEEVVIRASGGQYTVDDKGDTEASVWISAQGDPSRPATDPRLPCHQAGCFHGQVLGRFVDRAGQETIFPIHEETTFLARAHGTLTFGINDLELYDNRFRTKDHVTDYLLIEVRPAPRGSGSAPDAGAPPGDRPLSP